MKQKEEVMNMFVGSMFVGHCNADQLLEHFSYFMTELKFDPCLLLSLSMDGPNVNLSFEKN